MLKCQRTNWLLQPIILLSITLISCCLVGGINGKITEDCEKSEGDKNSPELSLTCHLRTLNSEFDKVNFSRISSSPSDSIMSLSLFCSDVLFYQSSLAPSSLSHFTSLTSLAIEHCKLSRLESGVFNGLHLRNLTIQTHNTAWPALSLDLSPGIFNSVPSLERVDLSQNNIWTFPEAIFCASSSLTFLNVSMNRLQDIGDLGFREIVSNDASVSKRSSTTQQHYKCKMSIETLDISYNRLILLPPKGLAKLSQLKELYLQGNEISVVEVQAFASLRGLRIVNLADNKLANLPEELFHDSPELTEIYLQNNSISVLAPHLFSKLNHLVVLDLSHNNLPLLSKVEENFEIGNPIDAADSTNSYTTVTNLESESQIDNFQSFAGLIRLVLLNLGYNQLTRIRPESFQDLYSLQILNLEHNQITTIEPNTFAAMNNLHTLILSHNLLTFIDSTSLNGLFVLSQLSIDNNNISGIHPEAFHNCSSLKDLNMNGNALSDIDNALQNLTLLKTVDLGENQLNSTPHLVGLPNLYGLRLTGNRIVNVSKDAFTDLQSLKILNLARNQLKFIEEGAFDSNLNLQALRLDANYLTDISNLFSQCPNLIWLNISDNQLTWFDYALIPKQLQWIDLHKNALSDLGNYFQRQDLRLQTLDASFNRISHIRSDNLPDSLEMIFLNDNLIKTIEPHTFYKKTNLSRVDIFANQIETLELTSLRLAPIEMEKEVPEMYLGGNPIICDCNSEWLQRIGKLDHLRQHFKIVDLESVYCRIVNEDLVLPLAEVKPSQFLCPYTNHCFNLCECCEYNACDCQQQCPHGCDCFNDDVWATNIVYCSNKGHTTMPTHIPMDASQLYLDGNEITELPSHALIGRKNLQVLHLNNSGLSLIANNSLSGLRKLSVLHLEHNLLTRLQGYEFQDLTELRELFLQHNQISFISNETFRTLSHLEVLKLEHNKLTHFSMWILQENPYLIEINLSHNEWSCECEFLAKAAPWVQSNVAKLSDAAGVNCRFHGRPFSLVYMNGTRCADLNALSGGAVEKDESSFPSFLPLFGVIMATVVLLCGFLLLVCKRRKSLSIWAMSKCGQCYPSDENREDDNEKLYDAYVCYSLKDEGWVNQVLAKELESNSYQYQLCLHYKFAKTAYVADTIVEAVESSKRTILVLSKNFIQGEWSRFEFKSALYSALRGKKKLIVVSLGDFPNRDLDPDLRILLRSLTVLNSNDKSLFHKLKRSLLPPRSHFSTSSRVQHQHKVHMDNTDNGFHTTYQGNTNGFNTSFRNINTFINGSSNNGNNVLLNYSNGNALAADEPLLFVPPLPPLNRPPLPAFPTLPRRPPLPPTPQQQPWESM